MKEEDIKGENSNMTDLFVSTQRALAHEIGHNVHYKWYYENIFGTDKTFLGIKYGEYGHLPSFIDNRGFFEGCANHFVNSLKGLTPPNDYSIFFRGRIQYGYKTNEYVNYLKSFGIHINY